MELTRQNPPKAVKKAYCKGCETEKEYEWKTDWFGFICMNFAISYFVPIDLLLASPCWLDLLPIGLFILSYRRKCVKCGRQI